MQNEILYRAELVGKHVVLVLEQDLQPMPVRMPLEHRHATSLARTLKWLGSDKQGPQPAIPGFREGEVTWVVAHMKSDHPNAGPGVVLVTLVGASSEVMLTLTMGAALDMANTILGAKPPVQPTLPAQLQPSAQPFANITEEDVKGTVH